MFLHPSRYIESSDSCRSSKRSITSNGRYENNPIPKSHSHLPRSSPQPYPAQQQNHNSNDVVLPMDTIYCNLQEPQQQQPQIKINHNGIHRIGEFLYITFTFYKMNAAKSARISHMVPKNHLV